MSSLKMGMGRAGIDPTVPASLAGYFNLRPWKTVLDSLEVRAMVLEEKGVYAAIVHYDLISAAENLAEMVMEKIADLAMFSRENIIFSAIHTHTAPEVRPKAGYSAEYADFVAAQTARALRDALADLAPAETVQGTAWDDRFLFNRRYWMKSGGVTTNPGKLNPDILRPEGTTDPEIPMLGFRRGGRLTALIANAVNHSDTIGGNGVSADWPGFFRRTVEASLGAGSMVIPLIGAAGNINHFDVSTDACQSCYAEAQRIGRGIARTVLDKLDSLQPCCEMPLEVRHLRVPCPGHEVAPEALAEAEATVARYADLPDVTDCGSLTSEDLARKAPVVLKYFAGEVVKLAKHPLTYQLPLTGIFVNGAAILNLPGEPFVEIGLELRKRIFCDFHTLIAAHGPSGNPATGGGYIPNRWNYGRGGYETEGRSNPYHQSASEKILAGFRTMAGR